MNKLSLPNYNLRVTLLGGQTHLWDQIDNQIVGFTQEDIIEFQYDDNELTWQTYPHRNNSEVVKRILRLDINYNSIVKKSLVDNFVTKAYQSNPNIRVVKHDFEETLLMFILTQHKNIKAIRKSIRDLSKLLGEKIELNGNTYYLFPKTQAIAEAPMDLLLSSGIGFRAKYLKSSAKRLIDTNLKNSITSMNEEEARGNLKEFYGIGDKVADCVLCFSLGFDNVTPLDIWSMRILNKIYKLPEKMNYEDMRKWTQEYFQGYAAWAGHFLWEYFRSHPTELGVK